jgi:hypothetical protein
MKTIDNHAANKAAKLLVEAALIRRGIPLQSSLTIRARINTKKDYFYCTSKEAALEKGSHIVFVDIGPDATYSPRFYVMDGEVVGRQLRDDTASYLSDKPDGARAMYQFYPTVAQLLESEDNWDALIPSAV